MRRLYVIGFVLILAAGASGQWLEQSLAMPDSMSVIDYAAHVLFNPINHHAYIGGLDLEKLQIFDYAAHNKAGVIDTAGGVTCMFLCPDRQRVYIGTTAGDGIAVLDAVTDSVRTTLPLPSEPACGLYVQQVQRAYVGTGEDAALFVYDPGPDTLLHTIQLTDEVIRMEYDSVLNRVYGMAHDGSTHGIKVIDCVGDTLVGVLPTMDDYCVDLAFDPAARRLYCLGRSVTTELAEVWVYDVDSLALRDTITLPYSWRGIDGRLLLNPATNRLYVGYMDTESRDDPQDSVAVIDITTDSIRGFIGFTGVSEVRNWALNAADDKIYVCFWDEDSVAVVGAEDSIIGWVRIGDVVTCVGWNPENDELLMPDESDFLHIVSGANDSILARVNYQNFDAYAMYWVPSGDKLYVFGDGVVVVGPQNTVVKRVARTDWMPFLAPAYSPELNRLYTASYRANMYVFDCNADSVMASVVLPIHPGYTGQTFMVPGRHKLYQPSAEAETMAVFDVYSDSVVGVRAGFGEQFVYNPRNDRVYGSGYYASGINVIDPDADSILLTVGPTGWMTINATDNELYVLHESGSQELLVLDCASNVIDDTISLPQGANGLRWYEPLDKLYVLGDSAVMVVDCRAHAVTKTIPAGERGLGSAVFSGRNDKLWVAGRDNVCVIRCLTDSLVAKFPGSTRINMVWNSIDDRVYTGDENLLRVYQDELTGLEAEAAEASVEFSLRPASNPAAGAARFECGLPGTEPGLLRVFDATGRQVWAGSVAAGNRVVVWPGTDRQGRRVSAGVYLARLETSRHRATAKVVLR
jgi:DNA-binding beta-propeller fold protein YncE